MNLPGYVPGFLQPIENRILMTSTGIRAQVGVKLFGDDLDALQRKAFEIERVINGVRGAVGVAPSRVQGKPYLEITVRRDQLGRYGLSVQEVFRQVEAGIGGATVGTTLKGRERWPLQVRLEQGERGDIDRLGEILVTTPAGATVQLRQVADIKRVVGPNEIQSENGRLRVFVQANVRDRDLGTFVEDIKARIASQVTLAPGMSIEYSGQYEHQLRARQTLLYVFPAVILIIFGALVMTFRSVGEAAHVLLAVPFALTGGVLLQAWMGFNFSVAVWVGYIALFGTAIQTGVIMVTYLEESVQAARQRPGSGPHPRGVDPGRQGGRPPAPAPQGHDRRHHHRLPDPHLLAPAHRRGDHAAPGHPCGRWHDLQPGAHPHCHARHLSLVTGARGSKSGLSQYPPQAQLSPVPNLDMKDTGRPERE
jgi:Cu(I)/Ag(I) efflux system membrane protein CusA/SilA